MYSEESSDSGLEAGQQADCLPPLWLEATPLLVFCLLLDDLISCSKVAAQEHFARDLESCFR